MSKNNRKNVSRVEIENAIRTHKTMGGAAISLGLDDVLLRKLPKNMDFTTAA